MQKLIIPLLSIILILLTPAIAAAADINIGGELDFGKYWGTDKNICAASFTLTSQIAANTLATVDLSGNWAGNPHRKGVIVLDDAMVSFTGKIGTLTIGYFEYDATEIEALDPDNLTDAAAAESGNDDPSDSQLTASLSSPLTQELALTLTVAAPAGGLDYSAGINWALAACSAGITLSKNAADTYGSYIVNGSYTWNALKIYLTLQDTFAGNPDSRSLVVGTHYESETQPCYGQVEYDLANQGQSSHTYSGCIGYKINGGVRFEYNRTHQNSGSDDQSLKMRVLF